MKLDKVQALFLLADFEAKNFHKIENEYYCSEASADLRRASPWWLVETEYGLIKIGWRSRVIAIDWSSLEYRGIITKDDVTKDNTMVHAWSYSAAVRYLADLRWLEARTQVEPK